MHQSLELYAAYKIQIFKPKHMGFKRQDHAIAMSRIVINSPFSICRKIKFTTLEVKYLEEQSSLLGKSTKFCNSNEILFVVLIHSYTDFI